jgi:hypothetical protein
MSLKIVEEHSYSRLHTSALADRRIVEISYTLSHSFCICSTNAESTVLYLNCRVCDFENSCRNNVIRAALLLCDCPTGRQKRFARNCKKKCVYKVRPILFDQDFPTCLCKFEGSTNLYTCEPSCQYKISRIYNAWFPNVKPTLRIWQRLPYYKYTI